MVKGYGNTPNKDIPLNDRESGAIASIAMEQLRSYQERAANWRMYRVRREGRDVSCCQACLQALWFVSDEDEQLYVYTDDELLALKVAHIRQAHDKDGTNDGIRTD